MYNANNTDPGDMEHCTVPLAKPQVWPSHPFSNPDNHEKLLQYIRQRLLLGKQARDGLLDRMVRIDKNVAGWMQLSEADKTRDQTKDRTGQPQATAMNLPIAYVHLDDMMTYFAQTFAPSRGMFYQAGKKDDMQSGSPIVTLMNNHAIWAGYFRETLLGIWALVKYNQGGFHVFWNKESGPKISATEDGNTKVDMTLRWQGNRMEALDMYNLIRDPLVHPTKLHCDGEFSAQAMIRGYYWLQKRASEGVYFNCDSALKEYKGLNETKYYRSPPQEAQFGSNDSNGSGATNWVSILSAATAYTNVTGFELVEVYIRLNPTEFGLIQGNKAAQQPRNRYEVWRVTLLNDTWIVEAQYMNNVHGYIPHFLGLLNDDLMAEAQKSAAEILNPLQEFASFLMNIHVIGSRGKVWGTTFFDPTVIDYSKVEPGEVNARIPVKPAGYGKPITDSIYVMSGQLETKQTLQDLSGVMDMIGQFFPTQMLPNQIASIDRAVDSQVAAVQQGANRRQQKAARLLDDSLFRNARFAMYYNIIQFQPNGEEVTDYYTGKPVQIDLQALRNTDLPFIIGQGLKSIDRQAAAQALQQIIFALIQAPQAQQGIDLLGLIDYWTSMIDIDVDMKQFEIQQPPPAEAGAGTPEDQAAAAAAGGAPAGPVVNPATAPSKFTAPIYGGART